MLLLCVFDYASHGSPPIHENRTLRIWPQNLPSGQLLMFWAAELGMSLSFCFRVALQFEVQNYSAVFTVTTDLCRVSALISLALVVGWCYKLQFDSVNLYHRCLCFVYAWGIGPYGFPQYWSQLWFMVRWTARLLWWLFYSDFHCIFFFCFQWFHMYIVPIVWG